MIDYDLGNQLAVLEQIGVERRGFRVEIDWKQFAPYLIGAGTLSFLLIAGRRWLRRRRAPSHPEVEIYQRVIAGMARRGHGRARLEHESARAWAERLASNGAPEAVALRRFAARYEGLRFAANRPSPAMLIELRTLADAVLENREG